jgi:dTMP kinase
MFITFEGIEGSGKSTQIRRLAGHLSRAGCELVLTREPGGSGVPAAEAIRALLLDPNQELHPRAELLLFQASRAQHAEALIRPALRRGAVVLCDRYYHASLAYQGAGRGISGGDLRWLNEFAVDGVHPELVVLLDLEVATGLERARARAAMVSGGEVDRIEREALDFHQRVRNAYLEMAGAVPELFLIVDGSQSSDAVARDVLTGVVQRLPVGDPMRELLSGVAPRSNLADTE